MASTGQLSQLNMALAMTQGTGLVALALYMGFDGVLLTGWLCVLGGVFGWNLNKYKVLPLSQTPAE